MSAALSAPEGAGASNAREVVANPRQVLSTRLAKLSLDDIAAVIGKDDSTACKVRSNERPCTVSQFCAMLDLAGLKLVDKGRVCVKLDEYNFMRRLTARALTNERIAQELTFDDPE